MRSIRRWTRRRGAAAAAMLLLAAVPLFAACVGPGSTSIPATPAPLDGDVAIGGGRSIHAECAGYGSPTVVLVSGARSAADAWTSLPRAGATGLAPADLVSSDVAVMPLVAASTRVCAYDRPGTPYLDGTMSTTTMVDQPTTAQADVADLHAWLTAAGVPPPYVLVGHSWGGLIATHYASAYAADVAGLVLVDPASTYLETSLTPAQWTTFVALAKSLIDGSRVEVPDYADSLPVVRAAPSIRPMPAVVMTSDHPFDFGAGVDGTWPAWVAAQTLLADQLHAAHVTKTDSGHLIPIERPGLVADAILRVVEQARAGASR